MAGNVKAIASKKTLEFTPDSFDYLDVNTNGENEFDVSVINGSDKFASFQLELTTPGLDDSTQMKWYNTEPKICAKKPPGSETKFHVKIIRAPIPAYETTIDLILKVFSVEYANIYTSQKLKLTINKPLRSLRVEMPVKELKVIPGDKVELPIFVYNLSTKFSEITLTCLGLNPDWIEQGNQQKLSIEPGESAKSIFVFQPPKDAESENYEFKIKVESDASQYTVTEKGFLEVTPDGIVEFNCSNEQQIIPIKGKKGANTVNYELVFRNDSNLRQLVNVNIPEQKLSLDNVQTIPQEVILALGETKIMNLVVQKKQPWLGMKQHLLFEVAANLTNPKSEKDNNDIYAEPNTRVLALDVFPIIPFWLQVAGGTLILLLLLLYWMLLPHTYHQGAVSSVRIFGNGSLVFSASSDQTIRRWRVDDTPWIFDSLRLKDKFPFIANKSQTKQAVRVIRQSPKDNDLLAVGLENGEVKLWDISTNQEKATLSDKKANRVFDTVFTQNGRYLFSGHGSGLVNFWNLDKSSKPEKSVNVGYAVYGLAINESRPNKPLNFIAGQYNKLSVWNPNNGSKYDLEYRWLDAKHQQPIYSQHHYITSLATAKNTLVTADNQGYVTLWDINKIRQCTNRATKSSISCDKAILSQWHNEGVNPAIRSVALTQNACYLASAGDGGKIKLWHLSKGLKEGKTVTQDDARINSVDIKALNNHVFITSGDDKYKVRLYRVNGLKENENCK
ncbi:hypothetical protein WA1_19825 [Scytonema hofmannii PCC 7110]|uniref:Uncharacterized protein n=1 Tax=Scytonema hofmannii PCC 7110 TaxID=128403 RepID=A0A139XC12_9CYAN|nr:hypothetical protein [Scytonema hofmannii]KYC42231.1 hypothetical protein WA1_19825 [Scytonema hofmannii PCC 7110]